MKNYFCIFAAVLIWCAVMPMTLRFDAGQASAKAESSQPAAAFAAGKVQTAHPPIYIRFESPATGKAETQELELYVARALSALTAEGTPEETLKANAIAVRTLICFRHEHPCHEGFELCCNPRHCLAPAKTARDDCLSAAEATSGVILTRNGKASPALSCPSFLDGLPSAPTEENVTDCKTLLNRLFPDTEFAQISAE